MSLPGVGLLRASLGRVTCTTAAEQADREVLRPSEAQEGRAVAGLAGSAVPAENKQSPAPGLLWIITSFILLTLSPGGLSSETGLKVWPHGLANTKIHITAARLQDLEHMPARGSHPGTPAAPPSPCQMPALSFLSLPLLIPIAGREVLQQRHHVNLVKRVTPCLCPTSSPWDAGMTGKGSKVAPCKSNASQQIQRSQGQSTSRFK